MCIRAAAAIIITTAGGLAGAGKSNELREKLIRTVEGGELIRKADFFVRSYSADVYQFCTELKYSGNLNKLSFINDLPTEYCGGVDFHSVWRSAVNGQASLLAEERDIYIKLGDILGAADAAAQLREFGILSDRLAALEGQLREEYVKKGRLYRSVGILAGLMAGILVL